MTHRKKNRKEKYQITDPLTRFGKKDVHTMFKRRSTTKRPTTNSHKNVKKGNFFFDFYLQCLDLSLTGPSLKLVSG